MIQLISKTKILDYIEQYPSAKIALLVWAKEFELDGFSRKIIVPTIGISYGEQHLHKDFVIKFCTNCWLKIAFITWFGTAQELEILRDQEQKKLKEKYPDLVTQTVTFTNRDRKFSNDKSILNESIEYNFLNNDSENFRNETEFDYKTAINRISNIITAKPDTTEFTELLSLLPQLKYYEDHNSQYPLIDPLDIIKLKFNEWHMIPQDLAKLIGSEEDVISILSGKKPLTKGIIGKLYRRFKIKI